MDEPNTNEIQSAGPDSSAVRVALWRALHVEADASPHVLEDVIGLQLAEPGDDWRQRPDMDPDGTRAFRASIVGRARFIEDLVTRQADDGVAQYVILGAGLDTFAQRRPDLVSRLTIFEVDQPGTQEWKRRRLDQIGFGTAEHLKFVPVDFEAGDPLWERLANAGFDRERPAVVASAGVSMYLTKEAVFATLEQVAQLAAGSTLVMTFLLPLEFSPADLQPGMKNAEKGARASGTPFVSFFRPEEIMSMARDAGFAHVRHVSADDLAALYFADRADGLRPPSNAEEILVATT